MSMNNLMQREGGWMVAEVMLGTLHLLLIDRSIDRSINPVGSLPGWIAAVAYKPPPLWSASEGGMGSDSDVGEVMSARSAALAQHCPSSLGPCAMIDHTGERDSDALAACTHHTDKMASGEEGMSILGAERAGGSEGDREGGRLWASRGNHCEDATGTAGGGPFPPTADVFGVQQWALALRDPAAIQDHLGRRFPARLGPVRSPFRRGDSVQWTHSARSEGPPKRTAEMTRRRGARPALDLVVGRFPSLGCDTIHEAAEERRLHQADESRPSDRYQVGLDIVNRAGELQVLCKLWFWSEMELGLRLGDAPEKRGGGLGLMLGMRLVVGRGGRDEDKERRVEEEEEEETEEGRGLAEAPLQLSLLPLLPVPLQQPSSRQLRLPWTTETSKNPDEKKLDASMRGFDMNHAPSADEGASSSSSPKSIGSSFQMDFSAQRDGDEPGEGGEATAVEIGSLRVSDEEENGMGRKKLRLTKEQSAFLEESFKEHNTLNPVRSSSSPICTNP
ncbi:hypothetical protein BHE74_00035282 [Ensete ventricosum]|nr:hypothetical protein BHE74_00035282 [Ensete ventricosum]